MNLVGKIFVFLIFVMSLVFMTLALMAYATQTNWRNEIVKSGGYKDRIKEADQQYTDLEKKNSELLSEINNIKAGKAMALAQAETTNRQLAAATKAKEDTFAALNAANAAAPTQLA